MSALRTNQNIQLLNRMKKTIKTLAGKLGRKLIIVLAALGLWASVVQPAQAQIGTYVVPRVYTLWYGTLTNAQSITNVVTFTNMLNMSGWHNIDLWATYAPAYQTNVGMWASNIALSLDFSPGTGNLYSNSVTGSTNTSAGWSNNVVWTTSHPWTWTLPNTGNQTNIYVTNIPAFFGDGVMWFKGSWLTSATTNQNGAQIQFDVTLTP